MTMTMALGKKVKELREQAGLTQAHVASYVKVDQSLISKIEKGERAMSSEMMEKLSALFCYPLVSVISKSTGVTSFRFAFRTSGIEAQDLLAMAAVNRIALNQLQMDELAGGVAHD